MFVPIREPRKFRYQPHYYTEDDRKHRIRFRRVTLFDPHRYARPPRVMIVLLLLIVIILYLSGGLRPVPRPVRLTLEDAAGVAPNGENSFIVLRENDGE
ncbi:MAG: hypothetical protein ACK4OO_00830 [bacterium]